MFVYYRLTNREVRLSFCLVRMYAAYVQMCPSSLVREIELAAEIRGAPARPAGRMPTACCLFLFVVQINTHKVPATAKSADTEVLLRSIKQKRQGGWCWNHRDPLVLLVTFWKTRQPGQAAPCSVPRPQLVGRWTHSICVRGSNPRRSWVRPLPSTAPFRQPHGRITSPAIEEASKYLSCSFRHEPFFEPCDHSGYAQSPSLLRIRWTSAAIGASIACHCCPSMPCLVRIRCFDNIYTARRAARGP